MMHRGKHSDPAPCLMKTLLVFQSVISCTITYKLRLLCYSVGYHPHRSLSIFQEKQQHQGCVPDQGTPHQDQRSTSLFSITYRRSCLSLSSQTLIIIPSHPPSTEEFPFSLEAQRTVHSPAGVQCCHLNVCLMLTQCLGCKHKGTSSWDQSSQGQVIIDQVLKPQHHP